MNPYQQVMQPGFQQQMMPAMQQPGFPQAQGMAQPAQPMAQASQQQLDANAMYQQAAMTQMQQMQQMGMMQAVQYPGYYQMQQPVFDANAQMQYAMGAYPGMVPGGNMTGQQQQMTMPGQATVTQAVSSSFDPSTVSLPVSQNVAPLAASNQPQQQPTLHVVNKQEPVSQRSYPSSITSQPDMPQQPSNVTASIATSKPSGTTSSTDAETLPSLRDQLTELNGKIRQYEADYKKWYQEFLQWQKQHESHPDQRQFVEYQKQYQATIEEQQKNLQSQRADLQRKISEKESSIKSQNISTSGGQMQSQNFSSHIGATGVSGGPAMSYTNANSGHSNPVVAPPEQKVLHTQTWPPASHGDQSSQHQSRFQSQQRNAINPVASQAPHPEYQSSALQGSRSNALSMPGSMVAKVENYLHTAGGKSQTINASNAGGSQGAPYSQASQYGGQHGVKKEFAKPPYSQANQYGGPQAVNQKFGSSTSVPGSLGSQQARQGGVAGESGANRGSNQSGSLGQGPPQHDRQTYGSQSHEHDVNVGDQHEPTHGFGGPHEEYEEMASRHLAPGHDQFGQHSNPPNHQQQIRQDQLASLHGHRERFVGPTDGQEEFSGPHTQHQRFYGPRGQFARFQEPHGPRERFPGPRERFPGPRERFPGPHSQQEQFPRAMNHRERFPGSYEQEERFVRPFGPHGRFPPPRDGQPRFPRGPNHQERFLGPPSHQQRVRGPLGPRGLRQRFPGPQERFPGPRNHLERYQGDFNEPDHLARPHDQSPRFSRPHGQQERFPGPHSQQERFPRPHGQQEHFPRPPSQQERFSAPHSQQKHLPGPQAKQLDRPDKQQHVGAPSEWPASRSQQKTEENFYKDPDFSFDDAGGNDNEQKNITSFQTSSGQQDKAATASSIHTAKAGQDGPRENNNSSKEQMQKQTSSAGSASEEANTTDTTQDKNEQGNDCKQSDDSTAEKKKEKPAQPEGTPSEKPGESDSRSEPAPAASKNVNLNQPILGRLYPGAIDLSVTKKEQCRYFPRCRYGASCFYRHPPCSAGKSCSKHTCILDHSPQVQEMAAQAAKNQSLRNEGASTSAGNATDTGTAAAKAPKPSNNAPTGWDDANRRPPGNVGPKRMLPSPPRRPEMPPMLRPRRPIGVLTRTAGETDAEFDARYEQWNKENFPEEYDSMYEARKREVMGQIRDNSYRMEDRRRGEQGRFARDDRRAMADDYEDNRYTEYDYRDRERYDDCDEPMDTQYDTTQDNYDNYSRRDPPFRGDFDRRFSPPASTARSDVITVDYSHGKTPGVRLDEPKSGREYTDTREVFDYSSRDNFGHAERQQNFDDDWDRGRPYDRYADDARREELGRSRDRHRSRSPITGGPRSRLRSPDDDEMMTQRVSKIEVTAIKDLLDKPSREKRPKQIVIILRGVPGCGKTHIAKLIKDKELSHDAPAPRILALDDYFLQEVETADESASSSKKTTKSMEYVYEEEMEDAYRASLLKSFNKTLEDGFFPMIIVDAINNKISHFEKMWSDAKHKGFEVYIAALHGDPSECAERNIHKRTQEDIEKLLKGWEPTPKHFKRLDVRSLLQDAAIDEVEMEEVEPEKVTDDLGDEGEDDDDEKNEDEEDGLVHFHIPKSKWEDNKEETLAKLDGIRSKNKKKSTTKVTSLLDDDIDDDPYDDKEEDMRIGKKRVRWADIEERKQVEHRKKIGFCIGTDWSMLTDPNAEVPE